MSDTFGPTSSAPFATWDRDSRSWKTSEDTSLWALTLSSLTLPTSGGLRNGSLYERPTPEPATSALDCSSLPTPTRADYRSHNPNPGARNQGGGVMPASEHSLAAKIATMLPTPRTTDSHGPGLHGQGGQDLRTVVSLLPTPAVNDMGEGKTLEWWDDWAPRQKAADGRPAPHGRSLAIEAQRMLPTPRAQDEYERRNMKTMERIRDEGGDMTLPTWAKVVAPLLPTPTSQAAKHGELSPVEREGNRPQDKGNLWVVMPRLVGETMAQQSPDGSASSDDQPHRQLSLDELAHPA